MPDLKVQKAVYIVQHPLSRPMEVAIDTEGIIGFAAGDKRLRYRTNTQRGSSGSPCFGWGWQWIALHHSGDPAYKLRFNQGIPVSAIVRLLQKRGKSAALGGNV